MTLCDKLAAFFEERPHVWVDGIRLATVAGIYGWRSRCADLRKRGMSIENRQRRITGNNGKQFVISEYRYVPAVREPEQLTLHEARG